MVEPPSGARERHALTLSRHGYNVVPADGPQEARSKWHPQHYGLVIVSLDGFADEAGELCDGFKDSDSRQLIAMIFHPDQSLPATDCPTLIFTTEPDEYFLARVDTLTAAALVA
ncbi:MAG TPA: hypothetical protein VMU28_03590 [Terriglobales bacterium]|nr:hypothetical protein [Terriglobales bacterium]